MSFSFRTDLRWSPAHISLLGRLWAQHLQAGVGDCVTNPAFPLFEVLSRSSTYKNWKWVWLRQAIINSEHTGTVEWLYRAKQCGNQLTAIRSTKFRSYSVGMGRVHVLWSATLDLFVVLLIRCPGLSCCKFFYFWVYTVKYAAWGAHGYSPA